MVLSMLLVVANSARANELVLIGTTAGPWQPLSAFELRKMYMGLPVSRDGTPLTPLRNSQSQEITQLFQEVLSIIDTKGILNIITAYFIIILRIMVEINTILLTQILLFITALFIRTLLHKEEI